MKILIYCAGLMIIALIAQTALFWQSSARIIYAQAEEISRGTLENLQDDLYGFHKEIENSVINLYNQGQGQLVRALSEGGAFDSSGQSKFSQSAYELAHTAFVPAQNLAALYIYTAGNTLVASYRHAHTPKYTYPENIFNGTETDETRLIGAYISGEGRTMLITSNFNTSRGLRLVRYVMKLYNESSNCIGYVVCDVDPKPLLQIIDRYRYVDGQFIWLQAGGDVTALMNGGLMPGQAEIFEEIAGRIKSGDSESEVSSGGGGFELYKAAGRKYSLTVYSLLPKTSLELNQQVLLRNLSLIVLAILAVFILMYALISTGLTKPLTYVVQTMHRIKGGEIGLRLKPMRQDEIGLLSREFNDMLDNTAALMEKEYNARLLANEAKYKALQAQVNPHFLYNTLNTMSGIATASGVPAVGTLCRALSNMFRYSLNMETPFATLGEEIRHIKNYMYVMNVRMNNSVELKIKVDSNLLDLRLPRLSIQPLVENALIHGLKNKLGDKKVIVMAEQIGESLSLSIEDNGLGMDAEEMSKKLQSANDDALKQNRGIGLRNINARVKLLYGEVFGISVRSGAGLGSTVTLTIPVIGEDMHGPKEL
ncbi:MAG: histidine kinase [Clostridiales bacterium]|nr:histidine kinase [Clostridiales bacterium]